MSGTGQRRSFVYWPLLVLSACLAMRLRRFCMGRGDHIWSLSWRFGNLQPSLPQLSILTNFGALGGAYAWFVATGPAQILAIIFVYFIMRQAFKGMLGPMVGILATGALVIGMAWLIIGAISGLFGLVLAILAGGVTTVLAYAALDRLLNLGVFEFIKSNLPNMGQLASG